MHTFLVVIYKRRISEVVTLNSLCKMEPIQDGMPGLFIWDNSPLQFQQQSLDRLDELRRKFSTVEYYRAAENVSLSVLYNHVLNKVLQQTGNSVTILDHDSEVSLDFLPKINDFLSGMQFVVPKVISNRTGRIVSPRYQASHYFSIRPPEPRAVSETAVGEHTTKDFFAVGSGMTLTSKLWATGARFDEALAFYGIDTEFCRDYSVAHPSFIVADTCLYHDISSEGTEDIGTQKWRFNSHMNYWRYQLRKHSCLPHCAIEIYVTAWCTLIGLHFSLKRFWSRDVRHLS